MLWFSLLLWDYSWIISYSWLNFSCNCLSDCKYVSLIFFSASAIILLYSYYLSFLSFSAALSASRSIRLSRSLFSSKSTLRYFSNSYYFSALLTSLSRASSYSRACISYFSTCSTSWARESNLMWFLGADVYKFLTFSSCALLIYCNLYLNTAYCASC